MLNSVHNASILYMFHAGYALKQFIAEGRVSANEIAKILGVSKQAIYGLYGNETIPAVYVEKLKEKKLKIVGLTTKQDVSNISNGEINSHGEPPSEANDALKDKYIAQLEEQVQLQKDFIALLKQRVDRDAPLRKH